MPGQTPAASVEPHGCLVELHLPIWTAPSCSKCINMANLSPPFSSLTFPFKCPFNYIVQEFPSQPCLAIVVAADVLLTIVEYGLKPSASLSVFFCLVFEERSELLAVLLPHVRRSLEVAQIEAPDIILLLEAEVGSTTAPKVDYFLLRILRRMPLSALLGLIMARDGLRPVLEEQCEVLRCLLG